MDQDQHEPTTAELVAMLVANEGHRYALVGSMDEALEGRAMIHDTVGRTWIRITSQDGGDDLHRDTVRKMLKGGVEVKKSK